MGLIKPKHNWTPMPNTWLKDKRLKLKTLGLLVKLNSLPDNWEFSIRGIASIMDEGEDSVRAAVTQAEKLGYLTREGRVRNEQGHFRGGDWVLHIKPFDSPSEDTEKPMPENPTLDTTLQYKKERKEELNNLTGGGKSPDGTSKEEIVTVERWGYGQKGDWKRLRTVYTTTEQADTIESASENDYPEFEYWASATLASRGGNSRTMKGYKKTCFKVIYPDSEEEEPVVDEDTMARLAEERFQKLQAEKNKEVGNGSQSKE